MVSVSINLCFLMVAHSEHCREKIVGLHISHLRPNGQDERLTIPCNRRKYCIEYQCGYRKGQRDDITADDTLAIDEVRGPLGQLLHANQQLVKSFQACFLNTDSLRGLPFRWSSCL